LLGGGLDLHRLLTGPGDGRAGPLEVETLGQLPAGLVGRVVHLLPVEFGDDVEAGFGSHVCSHPQVPGPGTLVRPMDGDRSRPGRWHATAPAAAVTELSPRPPGTPWDAGGRYPISSLGRRPLFSFMREAERRAQHQAGCPSGQREQTVNLPAQPT